MVYVSRLMSEGVMKLKLKPETTLMKLLATLLTRCGPHLAYYFYIILWHLSH